MKNLLKIKLDNAFRKARKFVGRQRHDWLTWKQPEPGVCRHKGARYFLGDKGPLCARCVEKENWKFWGRANLYVAMNGYRRRYEDEDENVTGKQLMLLEKKGN